MPPRQSTQLPGDISSFVERRRICDHLRGEERPNKEEMAELVRDINEHCRGTDRELAALRSKYKGDTAAMSALKDYESRIEAIK